MSSQRSRIAFGLMPWPQRRAIATALRTATVGRLRGGAALPVIAAVCGTTVPTTLYAPPAGLGGGLARIHRRNGAEQAATRHD
ncbi:hypothetical protein [Streptomyces avidinii]|uniref:Uncharacterized protein n=1 Tax=Streptomyces avidinii TaxID=1895 RepID=A0ABS4KZ21_STRAV|nr:hypothetical protein [Streptomyces avidinii]MBP2035279.1 hypothetical protein [Streptomyces avidinii]GGZ03570.1 hypothetical protein GCM10010343_31780 [Streptomyces avidinii]